MSKYTAMVGKRFIKHSKFVAENIGLRSESVSFRGYNTLRATAIAAECPDDLVSSVPNPTNENSG
jgi:hypothetical protein